MPKAVDGWKVCSKCREEKPVSEFSRNRNEPDGRCYQCKTCDRVYQQSAEGNATNRQYQQSAKGKATKRRYHASEKGKATYQRHSRSEKGKASSSKADAKRRALKADVDSDLAVVDFAILNARHPVCAYCDHEFEAAGPFKRTLDHVVPLSRRGRHTFDNAVFACSRCNRDKGTKLPAEWVNRWYE